MPEGIDAVKALIANCDKMAMQMMQIQADINGPAENQPSPKDLTALLVAMRGMCQDTATVMRFLVNAIEGTT